MARRKPAMVHIGDGIEIPEEVQAFGRYEAEDTGVPFSCMLRAVYDPEAGRYRARTLEMDVDEGYELTGEVLRRVRVAELLQRATRELWLTTLPPGVTNTDELRAVVAKGPTDEVLRFVAAIYRIALLQGLPPTAAVSGQLMVPRATAARWVTRARDRGVLTVVDPRAGR